MLSDTPISCLDKSLFVWYCEWRFWVFVRNKLLIFYQMNLYNFYRRCSVVNFVSTFSPNVFYLSSVIPPKIIFKRSLKAALKRMSNHAFSRVLCVPTQRYFRIATLLEDISREPVGKIFITPTSSRFELIAFSNKVARSLIGYVQNL